MLRLLGLHACAGGLIGSVAGTALLVFDTGGLGRLVYRSDNPLLPLLLIVVPFASLFAACSAASAILTLLYDSRYRQEEKNGTESR